MSGFGHINKKNKSINDLITECNDNMPFAEMPYAPYDDNNRYVMREEEGYAYHLDAERSVFFLKNQVFVHHKYMKSMDLKDQITSSPIY